MKKLTAEAIVNHVMSENRPFDYGWLRFIRRKYTAAEMISWAKKNIEQCYDDITPQMLGRAARLLIKEVYAEVY